MVSNLNADTVLRLAFHVNGSPKAVMCKSPPGSVETSEPPCADSACSKDLEARLASQQETQSGTTENAGEKRERVKAKRSRYSRGPFVRTIDDKDGNDGDDGDDDVVDAQPVQGRKRRYAQGPFAVSTIEENTHDVEPPCEKTTKTAICTKTPATTKPPADEYEAHLAEIAHDMETSSEASREADVYGKTSALYEEFMRTDGSVVDHWARDQVVDLQLEWKEGLDGQSHYSHGDATGGGLASNLKEMLGLYTVINP